MSRGLVLLNVLLVGASLASASYIVREVTSPPPPARPHTAVPARVSPPPEPAEPPAAPASYAVVASRNLFSPTRTEAPPAPPASAIAAAPPPPKPNLYGVVLRDGAPIAYLEDPVTKRVAGYRPGDSVAGGTVQLIAADYVVLSRPDGRVEVRLNDPAKPRPPAPAVAAPGQPGAVPPRGVFQPGVQTPGRVITPQPPAVTQQPFPGRRPLPPNLRRVPPGSVPDAAQQ